MLKTLNDYWEFLKNPRLLKINRNKNAALQDFLWLMILNILFGAVVIAALSIFLGRGFVAEHTDFDFISRYGFWLTLLLAGLALPVLEEIYFRWQLRDRFYSIYFVMISSGLVLSTFTKIGYVKFFITVLVIILALGIQVIVIRWSRRKALIVWKKYYVFLFYFTAIMFSYQDYFIVKKFTQANPPVICYILLQLFVGLNLGYLRVKYGLKYAILFHVCINVIFVLLIWLLGSINMS